MLNKELLHLYFRNRRSVALYHRQSSMQLIVTAIADIINIVVHTCPNFLQLQIHFQVLPPKLFYYCESIVVKSHLRTLYQQTVSTNTNELYSIGSSHLIAFIEAIAFLFLQQKTTCRFKLQVASYNIIQLATTINFKAICCDE